MSSIDWLASCLAPWAVAPHPNFRADLISGPALLALITEMRLLDLEQHLEAADLSTAERLLITSAKNSVSTPTRPEGLRGLETAMAADLPVHAQGAAALFYSVALADSGDRNRAVQVLTEFANQLRANSEAEPVSLLMATVDLHVVLRLAEQRRPVGSDLFVRAQNALVACRTENIEPFPTSLSLGWDSTQVFKDMVSRVEASAVSLEAHAGDRTWVDVMRTRAPWAETRALYVQTRRDAAFLREVFEQRTTSTSRSLTFSSEDDVEVAGFSSLLIAEFAADFGEVQAARRQLAQIRIARLPNQGPDLREAREFGTREAVALLSDTTETQMLRKTLRWLRSNGSPTGLVAAAERSIRRLLNGEPINANDLEVVIAVPDLIGKNYRRELIRLLLTHFQYGSGKESPEPDWVLRDRGWRAVARLTPAAEMDDEVISGLIEYLALAPFDDIESRSHIAVIESIESDALANHSDQTDALTERFAAEPRAKSLVTALSRHDEERPADATSRKWNIQNIEDLSELIESSTRLDDAEAQAARPIFSDALAAIRASAQKHTISLGGSDLPALATAWVCRVNADPVLIDDLVTLLLDRSVDGSQKAGALDQLVHSEQSETAHLIVDSLRSNWNQVVDSPRHHPWIQGERFPVFPSALRVALTYDLDAPSRLVPQVMELASAVDSDAKLEALKTLLVAARVSSEPSAYVAVMLQLAGDADADIRAQAGQALTLVKQLPDLLTSVVIDRLQRSLTEDSITVPLTVIHGLQQAHRNQAEVWMGVRSAVSDLVSTHPSRIVSGAAELALASHLNREAGL